MSGTNESADPLRLPLDLLETFVCLLSHDGQASLAAEELGISQPTTSKRLTALRLATEKLGGEPWLELAGKRWHLTSEGERVCGVVTSLVSQYRQAESFIARKQTKRPQVRIACGQLAVHGFLRSASAKFLDASPNAQLRISTPRGRSRIEGVAGGQFDMAIVTDPPERIREIAGTDLHLTKLFEDQLVIVAAPKTDSDWGHRWNRLPKRRPIRPNELDGLPLILTEPDASQRTEFDQWYSRDVTSPPNIVVETGGWTSVIGLASQGLGVGLVTSHAVATHESLVGKRNAVSISGSARAIDVSPHNLTSVYLISRIARGAAEPQLSLEAQALRQSILSQDLG